MFEETLYQKSDKGVQFVDVLKSQGIVPGIKVDTGLQVLPGSDGETSTQGLDNLGARQVAHGEAGQAGQGRAAGTPHLCCWAQESLPEKGPAAAATPVRATCRRPAGPAGIARPVAPRSS